MNIIEYKKLGLQLENSSNFYRQSVSDGLLVYGYIIFKSQNTDLGTLYPSIINLNLILNQLTFTWRQTASIYQLLQWAEH